MAQGRLEGSCPVRCHAASGLHTLRRTPAPCRPLRQTELLPVGEPAGDSEGDMLRAETPERGALGPEADGVVMWAAGALRPEVDGERVGASLLRTISCLEGPLCHICRAGAFGYG